MSTPKPRVTIVGLGLIGGSIGLALRQTDVASAVTGHDKEPSVSKEAKKLGAVDKSEWNLISACEEAEVVVLAIPMAGIKPTLEAVGPYLRPGTVLVDTATLKAPVVAWADEILPDGIHFVGANPIVSAPVAANAGLSAARADLFQEGLFCLTPSSKADPAAVKLATDLITILGASPIFFDPAEHDGLMAAVEHLPPLLSLALLEMASSQQTWRELRKVAGNVFGAATDLPPDDAASFGDLILANRDNVLRWLDVYTASLTSLRQELVDADTEAIAQRFESAFAERDRWLADRQTGNWEGVKTELPEKPNFLIDTFLGSWGRKRLQGRDD
ncbi:MAG: prephenate dehydrogenase [Anaerolineae bacterium]|jgi:prephenate dehydrogenase